MTVFYLKLSHLLGIFTYILEEFNIPCIKCHTESSTQ